VEAAGPSAIREGEARRFEPATRSMENTVLETEDDVDRCPKGHDTLYEVALPVAADEDGPAGYVRITRCSTCWQPSEDRENE